MKQPLSVHVKAGATRGPSPKSMPKAIYTVTVWRATIRRDLGQDSG